MNHSRILHFKMFDSFNNIRTRICHEKKPFVLINISREIALLTNYVIVSELTHSNCSNVKRNLFPAQSVDRSRQLFWPHIDLNIYWKILAATLRYNCAQNLFDPVRGILIGSIFTILAKKLITTDKRYRKLSRSIRNEATTSVVKG